MIQTEFEFELPIGYVDKEGTMHKQGRMRRATAADEIFPLKDPRVMQNEAYLSIIILTRVIVKLGSFDSLNTSIVEDLYATDLNYLQDLYQRVNQAELPNYTLVCPHCSKEVELPLDFFAQQQ